MEIKVDYDATMKAAQDFTNSDELIQDAKRRQSEASGHLGQWEGRAAIKGKQTFEKVTRLLGQFDSGLMQIAKRYVNAAERWTSDDEKAADEIGKKASWDGAFQQPGMGTVTSTGATHVARLHPLPLQDWRPRRIVPGRLRRPSIGHFSVVVPPFKPSWQRIRPLLTLLNARSAMTGAEVIGSGVAGSGAVVTAADLAMRTVTNASDDIGSGIAGSGAAVTAADLAARAVTNAGDAIGSGAAGSGAAVTAAGLASKAVGNEVNTVGTGLAGAKAAVRMGLNFSSGALETVNGPAVTNLGGGGNGGALSQSAHAFSATQPVLGWTSSGVSRSGVSSSVSLGSTAQSGLGALHAVAWSHATSTPITVTTTPVSLSQASLTVLPSGAFAALGSTITPSSTPSLSTLATCFPNTTVGLFQSDAVTTAPPVGNVGGAQAPFAANVAIGAGLAAGAVSSVGVVAGLKDKSATFNTEVSR